MLTLYDTKRHSLLEGKEEFFVPRRGRRPKAGRNSVRDFSQEIEFRPDIPPCHAGCAHYERLDFSGAESLISGMEKTEG